MTRTSKRNLAGDVIDLDVPEQRAAATKYLAKHEPGVFTYDNLSPEHIVAACADLYAKELGALLAKNPNLDAKSAGELAADMWRAALPDVTSVRTTLAYIACVAWGAKHRILDTQEVKLMMFTAQTQLSVLRIAHDAQHAPPRSIQASAELFTEEELRTPQSAMEAKP